MPMTIEQTTQLVQLILNAAIMVMASGLVLGVAILHQLRLEKQRRSVTYSLDRSIRRQLRRQARQMSRSVFYLAMACLVLVGSTGLLALRTLVNQSLLISMSLGCFAIGCLVFLVGLGFFLLSVIKRPQSGVRPLKFSQNGSKPLPQLARSPLPRSKIAPIDVSSASSNLVLLRDRHGR
jgi:hypothetical protein